MPNDSTQPSHFPLFRRFWKPATATCAGGTAVAVWFDEIVMFGEEILALIFLPILASVIYLLDILIFKSRLPQRKDLKNTKDIGAKQ
jgi:hypothetical protein